MIICCACRRKNTLSCTIFERVYVFIVATLLDAVFLILESSGAHANQPTKRLTKDVFWSVLPFLHLTASLGPLTETLTVTGVRLTLSISRGSEDHCWMYIISRLY